ncbi:hypothetical protein [Bacillus timonensis]|uniref:hypothetical protein n=1 Tax=Bacillus timonensis TaxID=1033734 RepID=UPI00028895FC|nr:hypothetical protein [Bacillus timonensis]
MIFDFLQAVGMFFSLAMCLFLFSFVYIEGLRISNNEGRIEVSTFITFVSSIIMAFVFSFFASSFYY